jgi:hypothetical protein
MKGKAKNQEGYDLYFWCYELDSRANWQTNNSKKILNLQVDPRIYSCLLF